jgi:glutamate/tyrosine decarboxylase-like PLP-dependent enzyme
MSELQAKGLEDEDATMREPASSGLHEVGTGGEPAASELLTDAAARAGRYLEGVDARPVAPTQDALARLAELDVPLQDEPLDPAAVLAELDEIGSPATVASAGPRFYGFVIGGSLPAALAANVLAGAWDQNAGLRVASPVAAALEDVSAGWVTQLLGLPAGAAVGFTSGATMANLTGLAAARHAVLAAHGWRVECDGLQGAPVVTVVVGAEAHASVMKALTLLGFGRDRVVRVPVDDQGRMIAAELPVVSGPAIVCLQAGNVNTGALDPAGEIIARLRGSGAWVHVDGAFGLWAAASPGKRHLVDGFDQADSWTTDAHKWLNVPYDSGLAIVRDPDHLHTAMAAGAAAYLVHGERPDPYLAVPEMSRRTRGAEVWAALRSLGRNGLAELIDRCCRHAQRMADALALAGYEVLNEVVLNQVLVSFGDPDTTRRVIAGIQADGTAWMGGTEWQGRTAMRISVSSWATTDADVDRTIEAVLRVAREIA